MLELPTEGFYFNAIDDSGNRIKFINAVDADGRFYVQCCDLKEDGTLETLKTKRVYTDSFHILK